MPDVSLMGSVFFSSDASMPSIYSVPPLGIKSASRCFAKVDFPDPLWPSIEINCPGSTSRSTESTAVRIFVTLPSSSRCIYSCFSPLASIIFSIHTPGSAELLFYIFLDPVNSDLQIIQRIRITNSYKTFSAVSKSSTGNDSNLFLFQKVRRKFVRCHTELFD